MKTKEEQKSYQKAYREKNRDRLINASKDWRLKNKEKIPDYSKKYIENNREKISNYKKIFNAKKENKKKAAKYVKEKRQKDKLFKLKSNLRTRIWEIFNKNSFNKKLKTEKLLGESFEFVRNYIEIQFTKGMSWDNYGKWQIDHKIPLASAKTEDELIALNHYTNLQPLWAIDNKIKCNKIIEQQLKLI